MSITTHLTPADLYKIQNKRIKTYRKIWYFFYDFAKRIEKWEDLSEYRIGAIHKEYWIDPRTSRKYFWQFFYKIWTKKIFSFTKKDIMVINQIITWYKDYYNLNKAQSRMAKYLIYFLIQKTKWAR